MSIKILKCRKIFNKKTLLNILPTDINIDYGNNKVKIGSA